MAHKQNSMEHFDHFKNKIAVCSILAYCDCELHQTLDILCVQSHQSNVYGIPGGKRDRQGTGRSEFQSNDEPCILTASNEFKEEVGEELEQFYVFPDPHRPLPHFDVTVYRNGQYRHIRVFYAKVNCQMIPNKEFGRFTLFEIKKREWLPLETIIYQLNVQYRINRRHMSFYPGMFETIKGFAKVYMQHLKDFQEYIEQKQQPEYLKIYRNYKYKRTLWLFNKVLEKQPKKHTNDTEQVQDAEQ